MAGGFQKTLEMGVCVCVKGVQVKRGLVSYGKEFGIYLQCKWES